MTLKNIKHDGLDYKAGIMNIRGVKTNRVKKNGTEFLEYMFCNRICLNVCDTCLRGRNFCSNVPTHGEGIAVNRFVPLSVQPKKKKSTASSSQDSKKSRR